MVIVIALGGVDQRGAALIAMARAVDVARSRLTTSRK